MFYNTKKPVVEVPTYQNNGEPNMNYDELTILGNTVREFERFDTFPAPPYLHEVKFESDELTSVCPITGQPDFYRITIEYTPDEVCLESKSLKLYLQKFRNEGIFGESLASQIINDIFDILLPQKISVVLCQKPRGGISITSTASREKDGQQ